MTRVVRVIQCDLSALAKRFDNISSVLQLKKQIIMKARKNVQCGYSRKKKNSINILPTHTPKSVFRSCYKA